MEPALRASVNAAKAGTQDLSNQFLRIQDESLVKIARVYSLISTVEFYLNGEGGDSASLPTLKKLAATIGVAMAAAAILQPRYQYRPG